MFEGTTEGWLSKTGLLGLTSTRHRRYCVLSGSELRYYKHMSDVRPTGLIDLRHYRLAEKDTSKQHPYGFRLVSQCKHHRSYIFYADHEQGCQHWIDIINATLNPLASRNHTCEAPQLFHEHRDDSYSVLDKWLNRLDLNDNQSLASRVPTLASSIHTTTTMTSSSSSVATAAAAASTAGAMSTLSSSLSPTLRPFRSSTESLDSLPSETTLSSSAGSRAHSSMGQNTVCTPHHSSQASPPAQYKNFGTNSNPTWSGNSFVSRSLSTLKKQPSPATVRHHHHQQFHQTHHQPYSDLVKNSNYLDSMMNNHHSSHKSPTTASMFSKKDWESDELFDFEDDLMMDGTSKVFRRSSFGGQARPPPSSPLPQIPDGL